MDADAAGFELFDHTADLGLRIFAATPTALIQPATAALYAAIGELVASAGAPQPVRFELEGDDDAVLLRDYLAELLRLFESEQAMVQSVQVERFDGRRLAITADRHGVDPIASTWEREVKAVTYHELALRPIANAWEFICIVDI